MGSLKGHHDHPQYGISNLLAWRLRAADRSEQAQASLGLPCIIVRSVGLEQVSRLWPEVVDPRLDPGSS